ncbi:MAG: MBL fold metallo-hydrolase [Pseudomonadota bacterium]
MWIEADDEAVLVDCGLSGKEIRRRIALAGLNPQKLKAILVSHEHRDHILGVGIAARFYKVPVYINRLTLEGAPQSLGPINDCLFKTGFDFKAGPFMIHPFSISHDAADPVGFTFEHQGAALGVATDLGVVTNLVRERLNGCRALVLESNHDPQMLMDGPYPWETKRRVRGRLGHLSNDESAELLDLLVHRDLTAVVLAHLSETNNLPGLALESHGRVLSGRNGVSLAAAGQNNPTPLIKI